MILEKGIDDWLKELDLSLRQQNFNLENYLKMRKLTEEEFRQEVSPQVGERLKRSLALGKLAKLESLDIESDEVAGKALERLATIARGELEDEPSPEKPSSEEESESTEQQIVENESERGGKKPGF